MIYTDFITTAFFFIFIFGLFYKKFVCKEDAIIVSQHKDIYNYKSKTTEILEQKLNLKQKNLYNVPFEVFYNVCLERVCEFERERYYSQIMFDLFKLIIFRIFNTNFFRDKRLISRIMHPKLNSLIEKKLIKDLKKCQKYYALKNDKNLNLENSKIFKKEKKNFLSDNDQLKICNCYIENYFFFYILEKANFEFKSFDPLPNYNDTMNEKIKNLFIGYLNENNDFFYVEISDKINALKELFDFVDKYTQYAKNSNFENSTLEKLNKSDLNLLINSSQINPLIDFSKTETCQKNIILAEVNEELLSAENEEKKLTYADEIKANKICKNISIIDDEICEEKRFKIFRSIITIKLKKHLNGVEKFSKCIFYYVKTIFFIEFCVLKQNSYSISLTIDHRNHPDTLKKNIFINIENFIQTSNIGLTGLIHVAYEYGDIFDNFILKFLLQIYFCKSLKEIEKIFKKDYIKYLILIANKKIFDLLPEDFELHIKKTKIIEKKEKSLLKISISFFNRYDIRCE
ncbi:hypothetical protein GVAV_002698 [Gurleya vavrai]